MDVTTWSPKFWNQNEEECLIQLQKQWDKVPLLNANSIQNLQNQKLVRFRGMIQDMHNPEYYFEKYEVINENTKESVIKNGKYLDIADCKDNEIVNTESENNKTSERHTLVVISIPALNKWVEDIETEQNKIVMPTAKSDGSTKRKYSENDIEMNVETEDYAQAGSSSTDANKRICVPNNTNNTQSNSTVISTEFLLNFPIENRTGKACHMKIYSNPDKFKLNDMFEFVGFLSADPMLNVNFDEDCENQMELQTHNPSPSLVPRIHCVSFKEIVHNNPLVAENRLTREKLEDTRKELMIVLTQLLLGDEIAAEYLLYHLISRVHVRQAMLALGKFSLNLSKVPSERLQDYTEKFYAFIEELIPKSHYFAMTLDNLNSISYIPKKDYDSDRLTSGLFQLSPKTHLIVDETKLSSGKLNAAAVKAVQTMSEILRDQKLNYDFKFYQKEYDCDIPFLVLSEGKSMLPCDCHIPIKAAEICMESYEELFTSTKAYLIQERLEEIRKYLTQTCYGEYVIGENVDKLIENEFVELRQTENITAEDLHHLLVLARLVCLSEGKSMLTEDSWRKAVNLEKERKARLLVKPTK